MKLLLRASAVVLTLAVSCSAAIAQVNQGTSPLTIPKGGTGAATAGSARTNLGLGSMATQNANGVAITGGAITGMSSPANPSDVATKQYVDGSVTGLTVHTSAALATTTTLPANTYNNGASGVGATLTANSNGALTIDGSAVSSSQRILVKNEAAPANNGIYTVTNAGSGGAAYVLTRATDANAPGTSNPLLIGAGTYILVLGGSANIGTSWLVNSSVVTIGTSAINWSQFTTAGAISSITGNNGAIVSPTTGNVVVSGGAQSIPGGRLVLQMSSGVGGIPTIDVPALATKVVVLLPGTTTWKVPLDWTSTNTISALGGSGGGAGSAAASNGGSSAGGAWNAISNLTLTPGATITTSVTSGGAGGAAAGGNPGVAAGDTYFNGASCAAASVCAKPGAPGNSPATASTGGQSASGVGAGFNGGNSGTGSGSTGVAGAGGAAGPSGAGGNGVNGSGSTNGAGGFGDNSVVAGGAINTPGTAATINTDTITERVASLLSGAGGAGGTCAAGFGAGNSSGYGGGVSGGTNGGAGATGCPGVIVITYTPSPTVLTYSPCGSYVPNCGSSFVPYYNGTNMALGAFNAGSGGLTLTLTTTDNTAGNCYEIFYFNNSGTPTIGTGPALTSCAPGSLARAASGGLAFTPDGSILANATASMTIKNNGSSFTCPQYQCSVLGMVHVPVNGQVPVQISPNAVAGGPNSEVGLDNYYNQIFRRIKAQDVIGQYTYNSTSPRALNNNTNNTIAVLDGLGVKQLRYGYYTSFASAAAALWAGTNQIAVNQLCTTGITHGAGFGAFMTQTAGNTSPQGGPGITFDAPYPVAGLNRLNPCDGGVNALIGIFQNDFGQYFVEAPF